MGARWPLGLGLWRLWGLSPWGLTAMRLYVGLRGLGFKTILIGLGLTL